MAGYLVLFGFLAIWLTLCGFWGCSIWQLHRQNQALEKHLKDVVLRNPQSHARVQTEHDLSTQQLEALACQANREAGLGG